MKRCLIGYLVPRKYAILISIYIRLDRAHKIPRKSLIGFPDFYGQFVYVSKRLVWTLLARTANCRCMTLENTYSVDQPLEWWSVIMRVCGERGCRASGVPWRHWQWLWSDSMTHCCGWEWATLLSILKCGVVFSYPELGKITILKSRVKCKVVVYGVSSHLESHADANG